MADADSTDFRFDSLESVATVDSDRYCESCGYNLRGQHVRRDDRSRLFMVRCPECHTCAYANQLKHRWLPWLQRLTVLLTIVWLIAWAWAFVGLVVVEGAMGDELFREAGFVTYVHESQREYSSQQINWLTFQHKFMYVVAMLLSFGVGLGAAWILASVMWFWKRWGYWLFIMLYPTIAAGINLAVFAFDLPSSWRLNAPAWIFFVPFAVCCIAGGFLGIQIGRPLTRLLIRIFVPQTFRHCLGFLWEVDGKTPPLAA